MMIPRSVTGWHVVPCIVSCCDVWLSESPCNLYFETRPHSDIRAGRLRFGRRAAVAGGRRGGERGTRLTFMSPSFWYSITVGRRFAFGHRPWAGGRGDRRTMRCSRGWTRHSERRCGPTALGWSPRAAAEHIVQSAAGAGGNRAAEGREGNDDARVGVRRRASGGDCDEDAMIL